MGTKFSRILRNSNSQQEDRIITSTYVYNNPRASNLNNPIRRRPNNIVRRRTNNYVRRRTNNYVRRRTNLANNYDFPTINNSTRKKDKKSRKVKSKYVVKDYKFECCVCYSKNKSKKKFISCNHNLCNTCYNKIYYPKKCPLCRLNI